MRRAHYLKLNLQTETPQQCIFFDTETDSKTRPDGVQELHLKFGQAVFTRRIRHGTWSSGEWFHFTSASEFWGWVSNHTRAKIKTYVFAHNLVFDMTVVDGFNLLPLCDWKLIKGIVDDPPTILTYRRGKASLCLADTLNWFQSSLAELGRAMGLDKLEMPGPGASQEAWLEYNKRDVEILRRSMLSYFDFIKVNELGNFQLTTASQAFTAYRHKFMGSQIYIDDNERALALARQSYHGGRVEAFYIGQRAGDFYLLDVNSMYPFVMATNYYPVKLRSCYSRVDVADLSVLMAQNCVIADVSVHVYEPCLPQKIKTGLLFPIGEFRTTLCTPELEYALAHNQVQKVYQAAIYRKELIFEKYVEVLYALRMKYCKNDNQPYAHLCKLMLNSLYGKFGQTGRVYQDRGNVDSTAVRSWTEYDGDTGDTRKYRQFGGLVQSWQKEGESFNSHPAIAAHVTSYGRMWLWKLINQAGRENVFYVDTDSLVVNRLGYQALNSLYGGSGLGELKVEKRFNYLEISGVKDYTFGDKTKIKGIKANAKKTGRNVFTQETFSKFGTLVNEHQLDTITVTPVTKTLNRVYKKGNVNADGAVTPFELSNSHP